eukprot:3280046-Prymnesium_polylepis.1
MQLAGISWLRLRRLDTMTGLVTGSVGTLARRFGACFLKALPNRKLTIEPRRDEGCDASSEGFGSAGGMAAAA